MSHATRDVYRSMAPDSNTSSFSKSERLLFLIDLLKTRGRIGRSEIARTCGISERTLYRDLRSLARMKIPIICDGAYVLKGDPVSIVDVAQATDADLLHFGRILDAFTTAIRLGTSIQISVRGKRIVNGVYYVAQGIRLKRTGILLQVLEFPQRKSRDIPLCSISRISELNDTPTKNAHDSGR